MKKPKRIQNPHPHSCEFDCKGCVDSGWNQCYDKMEKWLDEHVTELVQSLILGKGE